MHNAVWQTLEPVAVVTNLRDDQDDDRTAVLDGADAVLAWNLDRELRGPAEFAHLASVGLIQFLSAGVDHVPFDRIPPHVPIASNAGAYADPMAEHVLAMALALAKRLPQSHAAMARGVFDQRTTNRAIRGSVVAMLGFGGIGQASARLFAPLGARIHAINRSGRTEEPVEFVGTLAALDAVLAAADVLVVSVPLTRATRGLIGRRELELMKPDAILVNLARGDLVDAAALTEALQQGRVAAAALDVFAPEPIPADHPILKMDNVIVAPHVASGSVPAVRKLRETAATLALAALRGERLTNVVNGVSGC
jgi:glycerate dehydrogenase